MKRKYKRKQNWFKKKFLKNTLKTLLVVVFGSGGIYLIISGFLKITPNMPWWLMILIGLIFLTIGVKFVNKKFK